MLAGVCSRCCAPRRAASRRTLWVDGITAALAVGALSAAIVFQTVLEHASRRAASAWRTTLAYPLSDLSCSP